MPESALSTAKLTKFYGEMSPTVETVKEALAVAGIDPEHPRASDLYQRDIDCHNLGMFPVRNNAIAHRDASHSRAHIHHDAGVAVAERQRLIQLIEDGFKGRHNSIRSCLIEHGLHLVWLQACLLDQTGFTEFQ